MMSTLFILLTATTASASTVNFQAAPATFITNISESASMRCDILDDTSANQLRHLSSIFVIKGEGIDVASVTLFDPPTALADIGNLQVKGSVSASSSEGFLELTWLNPDLVYLGDYTCQVTGIDARGHTQSISSTLTLTSSPPSLDDVIAVFNSRFQNQHNVISNQMDVITKQQKAISELQAAAAKQSNAFSNTQANVTKQETDITNLQATVSELKDEIDRLNKTSRSDGSAFVAFDAGISQSRFSSHMLTLSNGQTVKFDDVSINEGGAYNPTSGMFKCKTPSVYEFHVHVQGVAGSYICLQLEVNGREVADLFKDDDDHNDDATLTHIVRLGAGDTVGVKVTCGSVLYDAGPGSHFHRVNYFTGKLLQASECKP